MASIREKYASERHRAQRRVFCIGGSTTFGWYCAYEESYPAVLESLLAPSANVLNLGLPGLDMTGSLHILVDLLRWGIVPDVVILLDGINEKQGFLQAVRGEARFRETSPYASYFAELLGRRARPWLGGRIGRAIRHVVSGRAAVPEGVDGNERADDVLRFVPEQAAVYVGALRTARALARSWGFDLVAFLQPVVWDIWSGTSPRYQYLKTLYAAIMQTSEPPIDLSRRVSALSPEMFLDWAHLNGAGNAAIANAIARSLTDTAGSGLAS